MLLLPTTTAAKICENFARLESQQQVIIITSNWVACLFVFNKYVFFFNKYVFNIHIPAAATTRTHQYHALTSQITVFNLIVSLFRVVSLYVYRLKN